MEFLLSTVVYIAVTVTVGCLWGLIPFFLGRYRGRPNMGRWGLIWCGVAGPFLVSFFVMLGFLIAVLTSERDMRRPNAGQQAYPAAPAYIPPQNAACGLTLECIAGPLRGQSYPVGSSGLMFGRDVDCSVRFPANTSGVSRHHCMVRWQQGVPVIEDLGSGYGTFMGDGRRLPPNYPMQVAPGSRFYLASPSNLFQFTIA